MGRTRAALALLAAAAVGLALVSGGSPADPRTPAGLQGLPPPFLGTAVVGGGGLTAAVDAYGDVVDLRSPGPAGRALIDNPAARQAAGTVPADTGIVPAVRVGGGAAQPLWQADSVAQAYLPGTNVARTAARFGLVRVTVTAAATSKVLALRIAVRAPAETGVRGTTTRVRAAAEMRAMPTAARATPSAQAVPTVAVSVEPGVRCRKTRRAERLDLLCSLAGVRTGGLTVGGAIGTAAAADRRWLARARPLGPGVPAWARQLYERSLLTLRALTDARSGAVAAGARDGWAYVWPRDAGAVALALTASGYPAEARRATRFLLGLDLGAAARFHGDGTPVPGRGPQGDAAGWTAVAARATGLPPPSEPLPWRDRPDYQERSPAPYLANALANSATLPADGPEASKSWTRSAHRRGGLVRVAGEAGSGLDSAAAWAVRPFPQPVLFSAARRTLHRLAAAGTRFGILPSEDWSGGEDPWTAPTAWSAWALAALAGREGGRRGTPPTREHGSGGAAARAPGPNAAAARDDRAAALRLLGDLRRAATPAGALPERVDVRTGVPRSTTPLAWSHAFATLALRELWPS